MAYKLRKYPDGSSYVEVLDSKPVTFKINDYESLVHLAQYAEAFHHIYGFKPNVFIPNLLDAQADRRFVETHSSGLKIVASIINSMQIKPTIFHPHNPEIVEALFNNVTIIDNQAFIEDVFSEILTFERYDHDSVELEKSLILMSSDAGGFKPLMKLCDKLEWAGETFSAAKSRSWDEIDGTKFVQQINFDDFQGKDILIIDDLSVKGGTFKGLANLLRGKNIGKLYLAVSHMTLQNLGKDPITNYYDKVFTTNSKYDTYYKDNGGHGVQPNNLYISKVWS